MNTAGSQPALAALAFTISLRNSFSRSHSGMDMRNDVNPRGANVRYCPAALLAANPATLASTHAGATLRREGATRGGSSRCFR